ncbi:hypothetical protein SAMN04488540_11411 [Ferrimonas sediminum]|uniref:Secreted protein n=1 Tax=Ferrimonas sediminum TaxID=718193 RepID=A0A1G8WUU1_9GAMM|nr:hypothetical protein [Ferrimonas sediminum]SDJ82172.1 hypothetical protein SAMN04488540_11411 [Ferrimonas sediminum]
MNRFALPLFGTLLLCSNGALAAGWQCSNDFESHCSQQGCAVAQSPDFTPLSVSFNDSGDVSVCAYSGCWQGRGVVLARQPYLVILGTAIPWSAPSDDNSSDMVLTLNPQTGVAVLQNEVFDQPLVCAGP